MFTQHKNRLHHLQYVILLSALFSLTPLLNASNVAIAWDPPTSNTDGSALTDLAGYRLYHGTASGVYTENSAVANGSTLTLSNLLSGGTHYFAVTALNSAGAEGAYSDELALRIPPGIILSTALLSVEEGSSVTLQVRLEAPPSQATTVQVHRVSGGCPYLGITGGTRLLFSATNWSTYQPVTLRALPDPVRAKRTALFDFTGTDLTSAQLAASASNPTVTPIELIDNQDADANGLPDTWEITRFGGINLVGAAALDDSDQDGLSNIQEYIAGTDPTDPASRLLVEIQTRAGQPEVRVQTIAATGYGYLGKTRSYTLQQCPDLVAGIWSPVAAATDIPADGQTVTYADNLITAPTSYYRVNAQLH